ncbi:MAG: hypothetical protein B2I17_01690 [Thermoplasmatales archaeon B_DKE]|nr:MAG: hypothetical protein B2I17_01690 [Thermoplasmatales archaeon B_DKE]
MNSKDLERSRELRGYMVSLTVNCGKHYRAYKGELRSVNSRHVSITNRAGYFYRFETENVLDIKEVQS